MRIFVTGGSGFIGRHLLRKLEGHEVLCLSRKHRSNPTRDYVKWIVGDLEASQLWATGLKKFGPDVCIHLAWEGLPNYSKELSRHNVKLSEQLLHILAESEVKKIVVAGSCWEYGTLVGQLQENVDQKPVGDFALAKLESYHKFRESCLDMGMNLAWTRIFYSYGSGQRRNSLLPSVFRALRSGEIPVIKSPDVIQDFIHVSDVASAMASLAVMYVGDEIFNIGSGSPTSVAEFVNRVASQCDSNFRLDASPTAKGSWASISKIEFLTGWKPSISLEKGIEETIRDLDRTLRR